MEKQIKLVWPPKVKKKISYLFFWPPGFDLLDVEDEGHGAYAIWERMDDGCFIFNLPALQWLRID